MELKIDLKVPESVKNTLDPAKYKEAMQVAALATGLDLESVASPFPGVSNSPVIWANDAQRRAYFAKRNEAGAPYSYTRESDPMSERLHESWVVEPSGGGAVLKNSATYAPYVIGESQQPQFEATGWKKLFDVAREYMSSGRAQKVFEESFMKVVRTFSK